MCAIAGQLGIEVDARIGGRVAACLRHRGPDGEGRYTAPASGLALFHSRLAIQDPTPAGHQPMVDPETGAVLVFNGEIYNFRELRARLQRRGHRFRTGTDTEVLLVLYRVYGQRMLSRLNGMFAFAIWDPGPGHLFLARDGLGVKPLYYARPGTGFVFASELKALLCYPRLSRTLDTGALSSHLTYLWSPAPDTLLAGVKKLEPGMALQVRDGTVERHWRHYEIPVASSPPGPGLSGVAPSGTAPARMAPEQAARTVREAVRAAVHRQMVADVPVGAFLSGGLDSSAVVAFAREAAPHGHLPCFTMELDDGDARREGMSADLPYARRVARHLDVDLQVVGVSGREMADALPSILYHLDEPQADPAALNVLLISRLARAHGIKVLLSGAGGDDILTGYRRHLALLWERYWRWLPRGARRFVGMGARCLPNRPAALRRLGKAFRYAGLDEEARLVSYFHWLDPDTAGGLLGTDARADIRSGAAGAGFGGPLRESLRGLPADASALTRMLYLECRYFSADHNLNYTDKMSMAAGVEVRVPLLDTELVRLAFSLPDGLKQRGTVGKWVFKEAMTGLLPGEVIHRPKTGFGAPLRAWLHGPLETLLNDTLSEEALRRRGLFDPGAVRRLMARDRAGRADAGYSLFAVLCVELWCRRFLDGSSG